MMGQFPITYSSSLKDSQVNLLYVHAKYNHHEKTVFLTMVMITCFGSSQLILAIF